MFELLSTRLQRSIAQCLKGIATLILKISIVLAVLIGIMFGIKKFNEHCEWRFGHAFFTKQAFFRTAIAFGVIVVGNQWGGSSAQHHSSLLNGLLLISFGIGMVPILAYQNIKQTNLLFGLGGTAIQIPVFWLLAWVSIPMLFIVLICQFAVLSAAQPVYILDR